MRIINTPVNSPLQSRIGWIDSVRALAILLVILGHIELSDSINDLIYSFHMPLFFLISGFTFNKEKISSIPIKEYVIKNLKRLVIPYFWIEFLSLPLWVIEYRVLSNSNTQSFFENFKGIFIANGKICAFPARPAWFLLTLFVALVGYRIILQIAKGDEGKEICLVAVCALISVSEAGVQLPWRINVAGTGIAFIFIGSKLISLLKSEEKLTFKNDFSKIIKKFFFICLMLLLGLYSHYFNGRISMATNKFGKSALLFYVTAILLSVVFIIVIKKMPDFRLLSYIGRNTLIMVGFHKHIILIIDRFYELSKLSDFIKFLLAIAIFIVLVPVCALFNRIAPYVAGNKYKGGSLQDISKYIVTAVCVFTPTFYVCKYIFGFSILMWIMTILITAAVSIGFVLLANRFLPIVFATDKSK